LKEAKDKIFPGPTQNSRHLVSLIKNGAFLVAAPLKTGLSASIFWLRQKDFRCNPLRPTGLSYAIKPGRGIAVRQLAAATYRSQFCSDKIA
jgi:hypothetical protein